MRIHTTVNGVEHEVDVWPGASVVCFGPVKKAFQASRRVPRSEPTTSDAS